MLKKLFDITHNAQSINGDKLVLNLFFDNEVRKYTLDLNRIEQLLKKGVDSNNEIIGYYSAFTEEITKGIQFTYDDYITTKQGGEHYTFLDTGEFYDSMDIIVYNNGITIEADTIKPDGTDLARKFGQSILGLTNESLQKLHVKILPLIIDKIRENLLK